MLIDFSFNMALSLSNITGITGSTKNSNIISNLRYLVIWICNSWSLKDLNIKVAFVFWNKTCQYWQVFYWYCWQHLIEKVTECSSDSCCNIDVCCTQIFYLAKALFSHQVQVGDTHFYPGGALSERFSDDIIPNW